MAKVNKKEEFEEIDVVRYASWDRVEIPKGATHIEAEVDYSDCYYESDTPSCTLHFLKKIDK